MDEPIPDISEAEIEALMAHVASGAVAPKTAHALLTLHGLSGENAARHVFAALGGTDRTELDADGRARYVGSGKLVTEVEHAIGGAAFS